MIRTLSALLALVLVSQIPAQALSASGRLQALPGPTCAPEASHTMACGNVLLQSSTIDLNSFGNQIVTVTGNAVVIPGCGELVIEVEAVESAGATITTFSFQNYSIGSTFTMFTTAPVGSIVVHLFSAQNFVLPLGPAGTLFLNPLAIEQWTFDIGIGLPFPRFLSIPNSSVLIGCNPNFQAAIVDTSNLLETSLTNNACFVVTR